jgi:hypothetical protein
LFNETWEWNGSTRAQQVISGPSRRSSDTWVLGALCYANCDASTPLPTLNINDFICFLNKFVAGCP